MNLPPNDKEGFLHAPKRISGTLKNLLLMKIMTILLVIIALNVNAEGNAQVTISSKKITLEKLFLQIKKQTGYLFFYDYNLIKDVSPVNIEVKNVSAQQALTEALNNTPFTFTIEDKTIIITPRKKAVAPAKSLILNAPLILENISGTVKDENGKPVDGATVTLKQLDKNAVTDEKGNFSFTNIETGTYELQITFIGFETKTVHVRSGQTDVMIGLTSTANQLGQIVVVGYGTQKKTQLIGSVSQLSGEKVSNRTTPQITNALTGQMPGVTVIQSSGQPGSGSAIQIRGVGSFGASASALVLVDGIPSTMNNIDPNDVESISVLKDASSAAIYGARAANGVILVTTKTGNTNKLKISYNGYVGTQRITATPDFVNSWEYAQLMNEAIPGSYTDEQIGKYKDGSDPDNYPNANYIDAVFKKGTLQTGHNITVSNGNSNTQYLLSVGYMYQNGIVEKNDFNRYNVRFNLTTNLARNLKLSTKISAIQLKEDEPATPATLDATDMLTGIISNTVRYPGIYSIRQSNGDWGVGVVNKGNPVAWLNSESFSKSNETALLGNLRLDWSVIPELKLSAIGGYTQNQGRGKTFLATQRINANIFLRPSSLSQSNTYSDYKTFQALAEYKKKYGAHELSVLGGYSFENTYSESLSAARSNLPSNDLPSLNLGDPSTQTNGNTATEFALQSLFGRIQYNYQNKYLAEGVLRYDGSSRFPTTKKYATFPAMAVGWRVSEENFLKNKISWLNELKLKFSYGTLGNQNIGDYPYQNLLTTGYNYPFGGLISAGAARTTITDTTLHWESTRTTDIGIEGSVFNRKLSFSATYFNRNTFDILASPTGSVSWVLGFGVGQQNSGRLTNKGWEFTVDHKNTIGNVNYFVAANFSIINNIIKDLGVGNVKQPNGLTGNPNIGFIGYPMNMYYGYIADKLFVDGDDVSAWQGKNDMKTVNPSPRPGDIRYKDISGPDGKPDGKVTADYDRVVLGSSIPKYTFGFNLGASYKGFDLSALLQGVAGVKGYLNNYAGWAFYQNGNAQRWQMNERWTPENPNPDAKYPRMEVISNSGTPNVLQSSYWVRDASYLRLRNIQLGYTFSKQMLRRAGIESLRVNLSAENLHTWSHYPTGWDPEINTGGSYYPILSNYTIGLNVNF